MEDEVRFEQTAGVVGDHQYAPGRGVWGLAGHLRPVVAGLRGELGGEHPRRALRAREVHPGVIGQVRLGHGEPGRFRSLQKQRQPDQPIWPDRRDRERIVILLVRCGVTVEWQRVRRRVAGERESGEFIGDDKNGLSRDLVAEGDPVVESAECEVEPSTRRGGFLQGDDQLVVTVSCRRRLAHGDRIGFVAAPAPFIDDLQPFLQRAGPGELQPERAGGE